MDMLVVLMVLNFLFLRTLMSLVFCMAISIVLLMFAVILPCLLSGNGELSNLLEFQFSYTCDDDLFFSSIMFAVLLCSAKLKIRIKIGTRLFVWH